MNGLIIIDAINPATGARVAIDPSEITQDRLDALAQVMDDESREHIHSTYDSEDSPGAWLKAWADYVGPEEAGRVILGS